jgi:hypothetical protein
LSADNSSGTGYRVPGTLRAAAIASSVRAGDISPVDLVTASFARADAIGAGHDELNIIL